MGIFVSDMDLAVSPGNSELMRIYGIGIDIVDTVRITRSIEDFGDRFLDRVFTEQEIHYCSRMKQADQHYAARFAAKEAVAKAFGTGIGAELGWKDMEILRDENGKPFLKLTGDGQQFAEDKKISEVLISLSHSDNHAAANAVAICSEL